MNRAVTPCDHCGQYDDHPKLHYGLQTYHHDCTPSYVKTQAIDGSENPELTLSIFALAENGTHGNELLEKIQEMHSNG